MVLGQYTNLTILGGGVVYRTTFNVKNRMCVCVCVCVRERGRERERHGGGRGREGERETETEKQRERETETEKHRDRQTDRQTDRQAGRQRKRSVLASRPPSGPEDRCPPGLGGGPSLSSSGRHLGSGTQQNLGN